MQLRIALALVLAACGSDDAPSFEVVVADARLGGVAPKLVGATATSVFWSAGSAIGGAPVATVPADGIQLGTSTGPIGQAGDYALFVTEGRVSRVDLEGRVQRIAPGAPDALGGNVQMPPIAAFTTGPDVSWGADDSQRTATLSKIDDCDQVWVTSEQIYIAANSSSGRRLVRIDQETGVATTVTSSVLWAESFPGGGMTGATYSGRIVDANNDTALWLVEELPSGRALVIDEPVRGEPTLLLQYVQSASGFFASETTLYWQEGETLLSAPREGGAASIEAELPGAAGAFADGYIYVTNGSAIERLRVE